MHRAGTGIFLIVAFFFLSFPPPVRAEMRVLYEGDSIYNHIQVREEGEERCMLFGRYSDHRQTCLNLARPDVSVFEYTGMMFVGFLFHPETKNVALLGLGGGYIPTVFAMHLPKVRLDSVEIDPLVYGLAKKYFSLKETQRQMVILADGRQYLKRTKQRYDQIWIDAFNSDYIPIHLTTREFLQLVKSRLAPRGIIVQNVHNSNKLFDAQVATFRSVFSRVFIFNGRESGNSIIVASDNPPLLPARFEQLLKSRKMIGKINLAEEARKYEPSPDVREMEVLTDDFNPANLLLHQEH